MLCYAVQCTAIAVMRPSHRFIKSHNVYDWIINDVQLLLSDLHAAIHHVLITIAHPYIASCIVLFCSSFSSLSKALRATWSSSSSSSVLGSDVEVEVCEFLEGLSKSMMTFKHQTVFDPASK